MEFYISKQRFVKTLGKVQGIVEKKTSLPVLANVLIEAMAGFVRFTGTDLETTIICVEDAEISSQGSITIDAKHLYDIVRELPEEATIKFTKNENNWVNIVAGKAQFNIAGLSSLDYPEINIFPLSEMPKIKLDSKEFKDGLDKTYYAVSTDDSRYFINGILLELPANDEKTIRFVSTDGHRLAFVEKNCIIENDLPNFKKGTLPKKSIAELRKILDEQNKEKTEIEVYQNNDKELIFVCNNTQINICIIDQDFPDYERVIPRENPFQLIINRENLFTAIKRISILNNDDSRNILVEIEHQQITLSSYNNDVGSAKEEIDAAFDGDSALNMGFNAKYLLEALGILSSENIIIKIGSPKRPIIIKNTEQENFLNVVMPLRSNS